MKRTQSPKLSVRRATVRNLSCSALASVQGGIDFYRADPLAPRGAPVFTDDPKSGGDGGNRPLRIAVPFYNFRR